MIALSDSLDIIRNFLNSINAQPDETVRMAAEVYRTHQAAAATRLRQCAYYLDRELVGEAVHLASQEPNLLQQCLTLAFPELTEWIKQAELNSLPTPIGIIADNDVQRLNQAFLREETVREALARHRRLAMAKAPLQIRLEAVRALVKADPMAYGWPEDLKKLESLRLKELHEQILAALDRCDPDELIRLEAELDPELWQSKPPDNWLVSIRQTLSDVSGEKIQAGYQRAATALSKAYAAKSFEKGLALRDEWQNLSRDGPQPEANILSLVEPALDWLKVESERRRQAGALEQAIRRLENAIRAGHSIWIIEERLKEAESLGTVPEKLYLKLGRYRAMKEDVARHTTNVALAVIVLIVVFAIALLAIYGGN
jgi:hypothetical protein